MLRREQNKPSILYEKKSKIKFPTPQGGPHRYQRLLIWIDKFVYTFKMEHYFDNLTKTITKHPLFNSGTFHNNLFSILLGTRSNSMPLGILLLQMQSFCCLIFAEIY